MIKDFFFTRIWTYIKLISPRYMYTNKWWYTTFKLFWNTHENIYILFSDSWKDDSKIRDIENGKLPRKHIATRKWLHMHKYLSANVMMHQSIYSLIKRMPQNRQSYHEKLIIMLVYTQMSLAYTINLYGVRLWRFVK